MQTQQWHNGNWGSQQKNSTKTQCGYGAAGGGPLQTNTGATPLGGRGGLSSPLGREPVLAYVWPLASTGGSGINTHLLSPADPPPSAVPLRSLWHPLPASAKKSLRRGGWKLQQMRTSHPEGLCIKNEEGGGGIKWRKKSPHPPNHRMADDPRWPPRAWMGPRVAGRGQRPGGRAPGLGSTGTGPAPRASPAAGALQPSLRARPHSRTSSKPTLETSTCNCLKN